MAFKLIFLSAVLLLFPPFLWFVTRRRTKSLFFRLALLTIWTGWLLICYPAASFTWALLKIQPAYDSDCVKAIQLSRRYMKLPYFQFQINLIGEVTGFTPRYYYLNTIGLCQNKLGHTKEAVKVFDELRTYSLKSSYEQDELEETLKILDRLRQKLRKSDTKSENK